MSKLVELYKKYKEMILYIVFGGLTTVVNIVVYGVMYHGFGNMVSTAAAWVLSVLFAYITNKLFVFESRSFEAKVLLKEMLSFFLCRLATGLMDMAIMYVFVDLDVLKLMHIQWSINLGITTVTIGFNVIVKILSNVLVIILNYIFSKLIIFRKKEK